MDDLVAFLRARLDEDHAELEQMTSSSLVQGYLRVNGEKLKADVAAKGQIVDEHERIPGDGINFTLSEQYRAEEVLKLLAFPYSEHPDYREEEWKP